MILNNDILTYFCWLLKIYFVPVRTFFNIKSMNFVFSYLSKVNR